MNGAMVVWAGMHPNDMRPKEDFREGCLVDCVDRPQLCGGRLLKIDADQRLGWVEWGSGKDGWWYLKDLVISGWPVFTQSRRVAKKTFGENPKEQKQVASEKSLFLEAMMQVQGGRRVA